MDLRNNLFGKTGRGGLPGRPGSGAGGGAPPPNYDHPRGYGGAPPQSAGYQGGGGQPQYGQGGGGGGYGSPPPNYGGGGGGGRSVRLRLAKVDDKTLQQMYIFTNICAVSPRDFPPSRDGSDLYLRLTGNMIDGDYVITARPTPGFPDGCISLSDPQRTWLRVGMMDELVAEIYNPFSSSTGGQSYLGSMDVEVGFASTKKVTDITYDQDALAQQMVQTFANHIFAPGQRLLIDVRNTPLSLVVKTVQLADLSMEKAGAAGSEGAVRTDPAARGIMVPQTNIAFYKNAGSPMKLSGSTKRAAANSIIAPDFKFEDMGIGGLDNEFSTIFRRAFASRIFPPGLIEKLGVLHVKGILLYGPPGTGKTLIARQIGKMLNAREPKVINGPEVLNKYVGQSEENIRKLFADAEKEYKEKGDESQLHVIIFDELDAVCKQRGSGAGGGTGVGDSVVNQLLSKLDGVDQLNNILLVGMTNRKDMIDDALLRPGRLEVQIEISLPDEQGRVQILKIHTAKMLQNNILDRDVDVGRLAARTKNFSGAELSGLVKSATSFAFNRHIKVDTMAGISDDVSQMKVNMSDFENALTEVKAAFGVSDEELEQALTYGILDYSVNIQSIVKECMVYANNVRQLDRLRTLSVLLHGPAGSGKTALATHVAIKSAFPFIKAITPENLVGYFNEAGKKDYLHKVFTDAYKSPLSLLILDNIERLIEWNPVGPRMSNIMIDMTESFDRQIAVPAVADVRELATALQQFGAFPDPADINQAINTVRQFNGGSDQVGVGIKTVLTMAESAAMVDDSASWFAEQISRSIAANSPEL
ncbi:vesicle-fusing ATPase [Sporothrix brasiliensis 5110]|uniref:Vesicular-fusion protein SEC18 n=1 Tax=Sporothrix brasiliensis 5110 TaxID=1398154 RepID=A0A0C2IW67_9PEZI|nr:vesicle-fusing ATPase [Sporothrix brasiliensis 5110]KIH89217.1 vesicle-fusing ATPase [Sporothrix brasiliensis 5110]